MPGTFDFWFDGGAGRTQTGYIEYELVDGTRVAGGAPVRVLSVTIEFSNGSRVKIQQESWGPEGGSHE